MMKILFKALCVLSVIPFAIFSMESEFDAKSSEALHRIVEYQATKKRSQKELGFFLDKQNFAREIQLKLAQLDGPQELKMHRYLARALIHFAAAAHLEEDAYSLLNRAVQLEAFAPTKDYKRKVASPNMINVMLLPGGSQAEAVKFFCATEIGNAIFINSAKCVAAGLEKGQRLSQEHLVLAIWKKNERLGSLLVRAGVDIESPIRINDNTINVRMFTAAKVCGKIMEEIVDRLMHEDLHEYNPGFYNEDRQRLFASLLEEEFS